jgi:hypothetical protein
MASRKSGFALAFFLTASTFASAQLPAGTILPARLSSTIDTHKSKAGERISARIMQDVPLPGAADQLGALNFGRGRAHKIPAGSRLVGEIVDVRPDKVSWKFDSLVLYGKSIPIRVNLRALASMMEIDNAQLPTNDGGGDRGSSELDWDTEQVGGDVVYGQRGGVVTEGDQVIGHSVFGGGVLLRPVADRQAGCRGSLGVEGPQAFWLFSASACGLYGYPDVRIVHAGRSEPAGIIALSAARGKLKIRAGSGILVRVLK